MREWRFPYNSYTTGFGLDTSDVETFKKDPMASMTREICQNSIDAAIDKKPVRVEFSLFEIDRTQLPGYEKLALQINACYEYKKNSKKEGAAVKALKTIIESDTITCMRISDFYTTGVWGANSKETNTPFYNLTKGSGESEKDGCSGGSKGIGKFASFVVSTTNTVFYSTRAINESVVSCGYIGISKLRSTPCPDDPQLMTMGIGFYGNDEKNSPILDELYLDDKFSRRESDYGTDVFIIGFNAYKGWQNDIIAKVLESFMIAISRKKLEVVVDGTEINANTVGYIIEDKSFYQKIRKRDLKEIRAQYDLLKQDDSVTVRELDVEGNAITVYVKHYIRENTSDATKHCVMVRYPYMKITHINTGINLPFSALCIIEDNELNKELRNIENPQHTDWEIKRLDFSPDERRHTRKLKRALENTVKECISDILRDSSDESTDMEGAGEFLPSQEERSNDEDTFVDEESIVVNHATRVKNQSPKTEKLGEDGENYDFSRGELELGDNYLEGKELNPGGETTNPNPSPKPEPKDEETNINFGNDPVLVKKALSGMRYRTIATNKNEGKYDCIFTSNYTEPNCEFLVRMCGDDNSQKFPVEIITAMVNGEHCEIENGKIVHLQIKENHRYKISYVVDVHEMFSSEVILSAYR